MKRYLHELGLKEVNTATQQFQVDDEGGEALLTKAVLGKEERTRETFCGRHVV
jgi:hypothetical protein